MVAATPNYREAGQLLSAYGQRLSWKGDEAGAQQALAIAMAIAKHEGDLTLEMMNLINSAWVDVYQLRLQESGEKSLQALGLMDRLGAPTRGWEVLLHLFRVCYCTGNLVGGWRYAAMYQEIVEKSGDPVHRTSSLAWNMKLAYLGGDFTNARHFCDRGLIEDPQNFFLLSIRVLLEYAVGEFNQGEVFLERVIKVYREAAPEPDWIHINVALAIAVIVHTTGTTKHINVARAAAATVLSSQRVSLNLIWCVRSGLALIAAQIGDTATLQEQYHALRGHHGGYIAMDVDRLLGLLAAASGELDEAAAYFEAALTTWSKGHYPEYAWTAYEYADLLLSRGNPEDRGRAKALLDNALSISRELGMVPLTERVLLRKESMHTQRDAERT